MQEDITTGGDFLKVVRSHVRYSVCPECSEDCSKVSLARLVYTFEECDCGRPEYAHLTERLHHRSCYKNK